MADEPTKKPSSDRQTSLTTDTIPQDTSRTPTNRTNRSVNHPIMSTTTTHAYHPYNHTIQPSVDNQTTETSQEQQSQQDVVIKSIFCGSKQRQWNLISDWFVIFGLTGLWMVLDLRVHPVEQCIPGRSHPSGCSKVEAPLLQYTNTKYTIPQNRLNVMSLSIHFGLAAVSLLLNYFFEPSFRSQMSFGLFLYHFEMYCRCTALFLMFNLMVTDMMKLTFGVPRPNFYELEKVSGEEKWNARKSFPSGHTSQAFVTTFWYVLQSLSCIQSIINEDYIQQVRTALANDPSMLQYHMQTSVGMGMGARSMTTAQSHDYLSSASVVLPANEKDAATLENSLAVEANRAHTMNIIKFENIMFMYPIYSRLAPYCPALSAVIASLPLIFSMWVASTRVVDHFHTPTDVLGGILVGCSTAFLVYSTYRMRDFSHLYYAYEDETTLEEGTGPTIHVSPGREGLARRI